MTKENLAENILNEFIELHDKGECSCEGFSENRDTRMCDAYAYLTGNISKEEFLMCFI